MICNICFCMLRDHSGRTWRGSLDLCFDHQPTWSSLKQSADMGCCICRRIWGDMPVTYDRQKFSVREKTAFLIAYISISMDEELYRLDFALSGELASKHSIGTMLFRRSTSSCETHTYTPHSRHLSSDEVLTLAKYWIKKCEGPNHKNCPDEDFRDRVSLQSIPMEENGSADSNSFASGTDMNNADKTKTYTDSNVPFYPTRLIELGSADTPNVKLIVTKETTHRHDQNIKTPQGHYVTLSHCWGKVANPFCLTTRNLDVFQESGIPLVELPRTFQHAIHFARRLSSKVKYLWIDSLCIIQGDGSDWPYEAPQMFQVYRNSYCNISATAAKDSSQGLYAERDPRYLWAEDVDVNVEGITRSTLKFRALGTSPKLKKSAPEIAKALIQRCNIIDPSFWDRKVETAPINTRAWVLQERLLAPRVLHFCEDQIAWECRELDACESASSGIENLTLNNGVIQQRVRLKTLVAQEYGPKIPSDGRSDIAYQAQENWKQIVERYSMTNLTNAQDKLIALAGIAEQMSAQIAAPYVAGMWRTKYFASQLLWRVDPLYQDGKFFYPSKRPKDYRAPSWSWAAIDATQGIHCGELQDNDNPLMSVIHVDVQPQPPSNSRFGLVEKGGFIRLECQRLRIKIDRKVRRSSEGDETHIYTWTLTGDREGHDAKMHPNVYLDSAQDDFDDLRDLHSLIWLVPAYKNPDGDLIGMLLHQKDNCSHFRRVGLTVIPYHVRAGKESFVDENDQFKGLMKSVIQIF